MVSRQNKGDRAAQFLFVRSSSLLYHPGIKVCVLFLSHCFGLARQLSLRSRHSQHCENHPWKDPPFQMMLLSPSEAGRERRGKSKPQDVDFVDFE